MNKARNFLNYLQPRKVSQGDIKFFFPVKIPGGISAVWVFLNLGEHTCLSAVINHCCQSIFGASFD